jgi:hypothetical protein
MTMVYKCKGAGKGDGIPQLSSSDYLLKETQNECKAAMRIVNAIKEGYRLLWGDIEKELSTRADGDWDAPGNPIDLVFLREYINHA